MSIRSQRVKAGKTVVQVAEHIGVTRTAVYLWEIGETMPQAANLIKLAKFLDCTVDDLIKEEK